MSPEQLRRIGIAIAVAAIIYGALKFIGGVPS